MKYKPYPKYKASGVEWLGEIPEGWNPVALKWITRRYSGGTPDKNNSKYWEDGSIPWIASGEVNQWEITEPTTYITEEGFNNSSAKWIPEGAIVMALAGQGKTKGMVAITSSPVTGNQSLVAIVPLQKIHGRFLLYWLNSQYTRIRSQSSDDLRDGLNLDIVGCIPCPLPLKSTQRAIAAFLDAETARIDGLVKDYEELIELLKEKRQALISRAATRGLSELVSPDDPEFGEWAKPVKLKDSGVEWIGEIPEGWGTWQLKRELDIVTSGSRGWAEFYSEEGAIFIRIGNLTRDGITLNLEDIQRVEVPDNAEAIRTKVCESDLLVSITADIGSVAIIENLYDAAYISQHLAICRFARTTRIFPRWAAYYLKSYSGRIQFDQKAYGGTKIQLSLDDVRELLITIPLMSEQHAIASFLDRETAKIDTLVSESESAIELLKEHRSALITNAVTGKINVENIA